MVVRRRFVAWLAAADVMAVVVVMLVEEGPTVRLLVLHVWPASVCNLILGKCWLLVSKCRLSSMNSRPAEGQGCCVDGFWISAVSRCVISSRENTLRKVD